MTDIVTQLRSGVDNVEFCCRPVEVGGLLLTMNEAADEIERLRAALNRIQTPKAFYVPTSKVDPEAFARMIYAQSILNSVNLEKAELIAEHKTRERYRPIEGERL